MIPKILHFNWFFDEWPDYGDNVVTKYLSMFRGWEVRILREVPDDMPEELSRLVNDRRILSPFRADLVRYWILYRDGGVYVDLDSLPLKNFEDLLDFNVFAARCNGRKNVSTVGSPCWIDSCFLGSAKKDPYWERVFDNCLHPEAWNVPKAWFAAENVLPDTGVMLLEDAVQEVDGAEKMTFWENDGAVRPSGTGYMVHYRVYELERQKFGGLSYSRAKTYDELYGDRT